MTAFATIVRAALDEVDDRPGDDHWTIRDANKLAEAIQVHLAAHVMAEDEVLHRTLKETAAQYEGTDWRETFTRLERDDEEAAGWAP